MQQNTLDLKIYIFFKNSGDFFVSFSGRTRITRQSMQTVNDSEL